MLRNNLIMNRAFLSPGTLFTCILAGTLAVLAGYLQTGVKRDDTALSPDIEWQDAELPTDYTGSKDRIEFELAELELFGPARSALDIDNPDPEQTASLRLIAIANLDGTLFALIEETGLGILRLKAGDSTQSGWRIESIDKNAVTVLRGEDRKTLPLFLAAARQEGTPDRPKRAKRER
jgi:hypothetical protein